MAMHKRPCQPLASIKSTQKQKRIQNQLNLPVQGCKIVLNCWWGITQAHSQDKVFTVMLTCLTLSHLWCKPLKILYKMASELKDYLQSFDISCLQKLSNFNLRPKLTNLKISRPEWTHLIYILQIIYLNNPECS